MLRGSGGMRGSALRGAVPLLGCLLAAASSTRPECSIMQEIEEERSQCLAELTWDNQTSGCRRQWDNITCWPEAEVGEVVVRPCPKYFRFLTSYLASQTLSSAALHSHKLKMEPHLSLSKAFEGPTVQLRNDTSIIFTFNPITNTHGCNGDFLSNDTKPPKPVEREEKKEKKKEEGEEEGEGEEKEEEDEGEGEGEEEEEDEGGEDEGEGEEGPISTLKPPPCFISITVFQTLKL